MRRNFYRNVLVFAAALALFALWGRFSRAEGISLTLSETGLTLGAPNGFSESIAFDALSGATLLDELPDLGEPVKGEKEENAWYGAWRNELWGSYTLFLDPRVACCLVLEKASGEVTVMNYESAEQTASLCSAVSELLEESRTTE